MNQVYNYYTWCTINFECKANTILWYLAILIILLGVTPIVFLVIVLYIGEPIVLDEEPQHSPGW